MEEEEVFLETEDCSCDLVIKRLRAKLPHKRIMSSVDVLPGSVRIQLKCGGEKICRRHSTESLQGAPVLCLTETGCS